MRTTAQESGSDANRVLTWASIVLVAAYILWFAISRVDPVAELAVPLRPLWLDIVLGGLLGSVLGGTGFITRRPWVLALAIALAGGVAAWFLAGSTQRLLRFDPVTERGFEELAAAGALLGAVVARARRRRPSALELLGFEVLVAFFLTDLTIVQSKAIRDLDLYLLAGRNFLDHAQVYLAVPLARLPTNPVNLPFLYPPVTLPLFALLAALPHPLAAISWVGASIGAAAAGLRLLGVGRWWALVILLSPPFFQGLYVGNVVIFGFLMLCLAPRLGSGLVLGPILKVQYGIATLWLVRERQWRSILIGSAVVLGLCAVTLPFVGIRLWQQWLTGLEAFRQTQVLMHKTYFMALPNYLPYAAYLVLSVAAIVVSVATRGRRGLARMGVATIVASPTVFDHGATFAIPALLWLSVPALWLALGLASVQGGVGLWGAVALAMVAGSIPWLRHRGADEGSHPLGTAEAPWETRPEANPAP